MSQGDLGAASEVGKNREERASHTSKNLKRDESLSVPNSPARLRKARTENALCTRALHKNSSVNWRQKLPVADSKENTK